MSGEKVIASKFEVSVEKLASLGVSDPYSPASLAIYASGQLTSDERLYFTLWGCSHLTASTFNAKHVLVARGAGVASAFFIVRGRLLGVKGDLIYRLGPGSVIGLAEGIADLPYSMGVICVSDVEARLIPIAQIRRMLPRMPVGLRSIMRNAVMRTLQLETIPESLE